MWIDGFSQLSRSYDLVCAILVLFCLNTTDDGIPEVCDRCGHELGRWVRTQNDLNKHYAMTRCVSTFARQRTCDVIKRAVVAHC